MSKNGLSFVKRIKFYPIPLGGGLFSFIFLFILFCLVLWLLFVYLFFIWVLLVWFGVFPLPYAKCCLYEILPFKSLQRLKTAELQNHGIYLIIQSNL